MHTAPISQPPQRSTIEDKPPWNAKVSEDSASLSSLLPPFFASTYILHYSALHSRLAFSQSAILGFQGVTAIAPACFGYRALHPGENSNVHIVHCFCAIEHGHGKDLPPLPADFLSFENYQEYPGEDGFFQGSSDTYQPYDVADYELDVEGRPRVPLIVLAQQGHPPPCEPSEPDTFPMRHCLSTISEKSERTEASRHWPSKQQLYAHNNPQPASPMSSYTSYGQVIGKTLS